MTAYWHAKKIREQSRILFPGFNAADGIKYTVAIQNQSWCNATASWQLGVMKFYKAAYGCDDGAYYEDILYHEYGHVINGTLY